MPHIPGLRSCYAKVGRLVYFGRMLDKVRVDATGQFPADYRACLGDAQVNVFDGRCCRFLGVRFADLQVVVLAGADDEEALAWAHAHGTARTDEKGHIWHRFLLLNSAGGTNDRRCCRNAFASAA